MGALDYRYDLEDVWPNEPDERATFIAAAKRRRAEAPHYATTLTGVCEPCTWCGNDVDDHSGLCAHCTELVDREPHYGYDRCSETPERYGW